MSHKLYIGFSANQRSSFHLSLGFIDIGNTIDSLKREVSLLRDKLTAAELKLAEAKRGKMKKEVENVIPCTPRKQFTRAELRPATPPSGKRGIKELVDEVVEEREEKGGI